MSSRTVAARLAMLAPVVLLLVAAPSRPGFADLAQFDAGDRAETLDFLPFGQGLVTSPPWLSASEFSRGTERSRPLPFQLALAVLAALLAGAARWRPSRIEPRVSQRTSSALHHVAGPRAPPLQLA